MAMDTTERAHIKSLLQTHRSHLHVLEQQEAALGLMAPPHIVTQIAEYRQKIATLEQRLHEGLPRHNLPPRDYERFIGRQKELAELRRLLQPYPKSRAYVITIDGIGGIGKSALALETAYIFRDQYATLPEAERFEALVWVSAKRSYLTADGILERGQAFRTLDDLYAAIAQVLDYPAITRAKAEEQRAIVEEVLREQRTLLILDNLETVDDEDLLIFLRELPDPTKAIITTRHRIDVAHPIRLTGMPHEDALALIEQEAERKEVTLTVEEREELWQRTGGVPLAIVWSIGLMGLGSSVESVLRRLGSGQSDIARFCFEASVAQIRGRDAYWLLLALSLFAFDANRKALGIVAGLEEDEFGRDVGLEELLRLSLVNKEGDRFSLLPLTRSFVQTEAAKHDDWIQEAGHRWQDYFYNFVLKDGAWSQDWTIHERIEREFPNIFALLDNLVSHLRFQPTDDRGKILDPVSFEPAQTFLNLVSHVVRVCRIRGHWLEGERLCLTAIDIGKVITDHSIAWRYSDLSKIYVFRGDLGPAKRWAMEAVALWKPGKEDALICRAQTMLGLIALRSGNLAEASILLPQALENYRRIRGEYALADFLGNLGELAEQKGELANALSWFQEAIDASRMRNDLPRLSLDWLNYGRAKLKTGDATEAVACFKQSLEIAQNIGVADVIARALYSIASVEAAQSQQQSAEAHARQALDLFRRLGMKREQAEAEALLAHLNVADESSSGDQTA